MYKGARKNYWLGLILAFLLALASTDVLAGEYTINDARAMLGSVYAEDPEGAHAMCAAWNGLVAVKQTGMVQQIIRAEASRHFRKVKAVYGGAPTRMLIEQLMHDVKNAYNTGGITWADMVTTAEACMEIGI